MRQAEADGLLRLPVQEDHSAVVAYVVVHDRPARTLTHIHTDECTVQEA